MLQYEPKLVPAMAGMIASDIYDVVLGSWILGGTARAGGMPLYKYISNRVLTACQNLLLGTKLSEFHTGYRVFYWEVLTTQPLLASSAHFVFDNQMLAQAVASGYAIGEISYPTKHFAEASSISFGRSVRHGCGVVMTSLEFVAWRRGLVTPARYSDSPALSVSQAGGAESATRRDSRSG